MAATVPVPPPLATLLSELADPNYKVRQQAARQLAHFYPAQATAPLLPLLKDRSSALRRLVARLLGQLGDPRAVQPLCDLLADKVLAVRVEAIKSLGQSGDRRAVAPLVALLSDSNMEIRHFAANVLGDLGDPAAVAPLLAYLAGAGEHEVETAIGALGQLADPRAIDPIVDALKRPGISPRISSVEVALDKIKSPRVSHALQDLLLDKREDPSTRAKAAWLLGRLRCYSALQALIETLADEDGYLRSKVVEALKVLKDRRALEPIHALLEGWRIFP